MKIVHINYPYVITDGGTQIKITDIEGHPKVGAELVFNKGTIPFKISAITSDSECVNGVCPIK